MFWVIVTIIVVILIIFDIYKWMIDKAGESVGLSKEETNSALNLWALFKIGKNKKSQ